MITLKRVAQRKVFGLWVGLAFFTVFAISIPAYSVVPDQAGSGSTATPPANEYVPGEVLVKFKRKATAAEKIQAHVEADAEVLSVIPKLGVERVKSKRGESTEALIARYKKNPLVEYAEPNGLVHIQLTPNDPRFSELYGLHNTGQTGGTPDADIDAPEAWDVQTGSGSVIVADIDTGVDYNHPDLAANMWTNPGETPDNGIDDDGNGYVDDVYGWDFANSDNDPFDDHGHGTHTSGTIAAVGNNGVGVVGVNWQAKIMAVKFLDAGGSGTFEAAALAIIYAADMGAQISSNSWGGTGFSQVTDDAIAYANSKGMLFVVAAGNANSNTDVSTFYPCISNQPNVLCVAATDHNDQKASFSNYGQTTVDLGAPGVSILSTVPTGSCALCNSSGYRLLNGTSMATPHVSGAAALLLAQFPSFTADQLKNVLMGSVDPIAALAGITVTGGRLNVNNALGTHFTLTGNPARQTIQIGEFTTYTITVRSLNGFNAPVNLSLISPDPTITGSFSVNPVTPPVNGSSDSILTISTSATTARGTYALKISGMDDLGEIQYAWVTLQVLGPDFTIAVTPSLRTTFPGGSTPYTVTVTSFDGYSAPVTLSMTTTDPNISGGFSANPVTPPANGSVNSTLTVTTTSSIPAGSYTLTIEGTDGLRTRTKTATLEIVDWDLVETQVSGPSSAAISSNITISDTVINQGTVGAPGLFYVGLYLSTDNAITTSDIYLGARIAYVPAGDNSTGNTTVIIPASVAAGTYYLGAIADYTGVIPETNETNNSLAGNTIEIRSVDLRTTAVSGPSSAAIISHIIISNTVLNQGTGSTSSGFWAGFYLSTDSVITTSDIRIGSRWVSNLLGAGESSSGNTVVWIPLSVAVGTYYLGAIADDAMGIAESDETNNALAGNTITITGGPSPPIQAWVARYNGPANGDDYGLKMVIDASGNIYVTGSSNADYATVKYDSNGNQLWVARYDNGSSDQANALAVDGAGNVYVTGYSYGNGMDYATVKYDSNGNQLWVQRYDNGHGGGDWAAAIAMDVSENVYVTGQSDDGGGKGPFGINYDYATVKYDPEGNQVWVVRHDGSWERGNDYATALALDAEGNIYVTGRSCEAPRDCNTMGHDYHTVKYDPNGNELWSATYDYNGGEDAASALAVDGAGNVYVTGMSSGDFATLKYDSNSNLVWFARYDNGMVDEAWALTVDGSGNVYATGSSFNGRDNDYATIKYNSNGDQVWIARYDNRSSDQANALTVDGSGNVYVSGYSGGVYEDYATVKYDSGGDPLWVARYDNGYRDFAYAIAVDNLGDVYVTGFSYGLYYDYATVKYIQLNDFTLTVTKMGAGSGTVTGSGIGCPGDCSETYSSGTNVTLTASANSGSTFSSWSGCSSTNGSTCYVTMNEDKSVTATFNLIPPPTYTLTVTKTGTGSGTVTSSPAGINCGSDCSQSYNSGTSVNLTATPASGSTFAGWGGACSGTGTCTVSMNANKSATATFTSTSLEADLSVTKADSPDPVTVGANLTYTITVTNHGPSVATGVTLTDSLPIDTTLVSSSASQGSCSGTSPVTCNLGSLVNGAKATVTIILTPTAAGMATNTVFVTGNESDPDPADNSDTASTLVVSLGDLDGSGRVDGFDLGLLGLAFGSRPGDANWNPEADLNGDGIVDGSDLNILIANFGKTM